MATLDPSERSRTTEEWERALGEQLRELRLRRDLTQVELAALANVSESTVKQLESGRGSTLSTLIRVTRALDRDDWLAALAPPPPPVSPLERLRAARQADATKRRRASRRTVED